ncbi:MAG TPA: DUF2135 domain-containing protein [Opitutaceae bacterium]|nr:DUF2135 domain-containing protein [Opitutaceae bacterium]
MAVTLILGAILSLFCADAHAQRIETTERASELITPESAEISAEIIGHTALTTFDLVFTNNDDRPLEGDFVFPLKRGQRVTAYAIEIEGVLRAAVPIENARPTVVYDAPGAEAAASSRPPTDDANFRGRFGVISPSATRRVRFSYQEEISEQTDPPTYRLPLSFPRRLKHFKLSFNVHGTHNEAPEVRTSLELPLPPWRDGQFFEIERADYDARGSLDLVLPKSDEPTVITGRFGGKEYFYADVPSSPILFSRPAPHTVALVWDASASGRERDHAKEFALLDAWFAELKDVEIKLIELRDHATAATSFAVKDGDWSALRKQLEQTQYDGGTSLDGLKDDPKVDAWVIVTDGLFNFGAGATTTKLALHNPVHTISATAGANIDWLRNIAAQHDGEFIDLLDLTPAKAAYALQTHSLRILGVDIEDGGVSEIHPAVGAPVNADAFHLSGVIQKPNTTVKLLVGNTRADAQRLEFHVTSGSDPSELPSLLWAEGELRHLGMDAEANRDAIRRVAQTFRIGTSTTPLTVLENVDDYLREGVAPPDDLKSAWMARREAAENTERLEREQHLQYVVSAFQRRAAWWRGATSGQPVEALPGNQENQNGSRAASIPGPPSSPSSGDPAAVAASQNPVLTTALQASASAPGSRADTIHLTAWSPENNYADELRRTPKDAQYSRYLELVLDHRREPAFYLACAEFFIANGNADIGLRILSNLAELGVDDAMVLRLLGSRLQLAGRPDLAIEPYRRVVLLRPEEPQSLRDLALAYQEAGQPQEAVNTLWKIVTQSWDARFPEVELIALAELNAIAATSPKPLDLSAMDRRLIRNLPMDLRVVLTWDAGDADLDLWVTDPDRETAKYDSPQTHQGGRLSRDFTGGFGPEEFDLRNAKPGTYTIKLNFNGDRRQSALSPITAQVKAITDFGTPQQKVKNFTVTLSQQQEIISVGAIDILPKKPKR